MPDKKFHKEETVITILKFHRDTQPRHYSSVATTLHSLEHTMRLFLRLNPPHPPTIKPLRIKGLRTIRLKLCLTKNSVAPSHCSNKSFISAPHRCRKPFSDYMLSIASGFITK